MKLFLEDGRFIDTSKPIDISMPLTASALNPRAWYVDEPRFEPVRSDQYIGSVREGGNVNFRDIYFNPHGHGTHTECLGHITTEVHSVNHVLNHYFFKARLISLLPKRVVNPDGSVDFVITPAQIAPIKKGCDALVIRTLPNEGSKLHRNYSNANPPYMDVACVELLLSAGIDHILIDTPSVDRESDGGKLLFHHAFWEVPKRPNFKRTITELIFVDNGVKDGEYILELQMAPFENDASPSRPVLYTILK